MNGVLPLVAIGTPLREGLERVVQARRGALVVLGNGEEVLSLCSGGFLLDTEFSAQRLAELAKMDGAIVLTSDTSKIVRANVHLVPSPSVPTSETGTRHRTAERVARATGVPVVSVSATMGMITVYEGTAKHALQDRRELSYRTSQIIQTLSRFRGRFDEALTTLSALELGDAVTLRDVAAVVQPAEFVRQLAGEVHAYLVELGDEGRLLKLQLDELVSGVGETCDLVLRDYAGCRQVGANGKPPGDGARSGDGAGGVRAGAGSMAAAGQVHASRHRDGTRGGDRSEGRAGEAEKRSGVDQGGIGTLLAKLDALSVEELSDLSVVAKVVGDFAAEGREEVSIGESVEPLGYRMLGRIPRLPEPVISRLVEHFEGLQGIIRASQAELEEVGGVGEARAKYLREGLARLAESSILESYE